MKLVKFGVVCIGSTCELIRSRGVREGGGGNQRYMQEPSLGEARATFRDVGRPMS